jgi:hypothetical protein
MGGEMRDNECAFTQVLMLISILIIIIVFVVCVLPPLANHASRSIDRYQYHQIDRIDTTFIESLKDGSTVTGSFILGSGYINGRDVYIYYTKNVDGGYVRNSIDTARTIIYMDENSKPYLISHYVETDELREQFISRYSLHVPNGTIMKTFTV